MRRSSIIMLVAAVMLGLLAVLFARSFVSKSSDPAVAALRTVPVVVAQTDIPFGEKLAVEKLKVVDWPADTVPQGSFQRVADLVTDEGRISMRAIGANEIVLMSAVSDQSNRLSTTKLLAPNMRAVSVPLNEVTGVAGMVYPGDRVDVYFTRQPEEAQPYGELLAQGARVLAVGQDMNVGKDKPELVKAATIEVTPLQAQKIALAQTVGNLVLALRQFTDESRIRLETLQVTDLNDGTITRLIRRQNSGGGQAAPAAAAGPSGPATPRGPTVQVIRGSEGSTMPILGE
ncbi:Flp pilus assembly protein CpaB [Sandarakinorhabdus sp.]|uniref:Flp pilus assembly protein CpaB n=1 Tax=Sandarakinorhabdus sp. TaxID=1916663 RepID=UPI00286E4252|nr:Flp pilus assembly protein CpaB [Sandarakinorhabdus sp.]